MSLPVVGLCLLVVGLCLSGASPVAAADSGDAASAGAEGALVQRSPGSAQSEVEADADLGTDRRLVGRESSERIDAVVIALWTIAGVMTVMLGLFLWHTSPRRRLRLAGDLSEGGRVRVESAGLPDGGLRPRIRAALVWLRSSLVPPTQPKPGDGARQESDSKPPEESAMRNLEAERTGGSDMARPDEAVARAARERSEQERE